MGFEHAIEHRLRLSDLSRELIPYFGSTYGKGSIPSLKKSEEFKGFMMECFNLDGNTPDAREALTIFVITGSMEFNVGAAVTGWLGSLTIAILGVIGWPTGFALKRWSCRQVGIAGALIFFAGTLLSVFATSIEHLFATFAVLIGIGSGMAWVSLVTVVESHFKDNFALTYSFICTGLAMGKFVLPLLVQVFIDIYGWRGGLLLESALIFHMVAFACLFRSNHSRTTSTTERKTNKADHAGETRNAYNNLQLKILEDKASACHAGGECYDGVHKFEENAASVQYTESPENRPLKSVSVIRSGQNFIPTLPVWIITFVYVLQSFSFTAVSVHIVAKMKDTGASGSKASIALSLIGLGGVPGRIINGIVIHRRWLSPIKIEITITCLTCVVAFIASAVDGYAMWMIYATCLGFFVTGFLFTNIFILIQEVDSSSRFSVNIGFVMMLSAIGDVCAGYLAGWPTGFALKRWSCRQVGIAGALIFFAGTLLSVFATSIEHLFATFAVLIGIGSGMAWVSLVTVVESHFKDNFALTYSFICTGLAMGKFVLPLLVQVFIDIDGWRGGLLLESALIFHMVAFACLFRSNHSRTTSTTERKTNKADHAGETRNAYNNLQLKTLEDKASACQAAGECDDSAQTFEENAASAQYTESPANLTLKSVSMIRSCPNVIPTLPVWIITFVYVLQSFSFTAVSIHFVAKMKDTGASDTKASVALSLIGLGGVPGRIINGIVIHRRWLSPIKIEITITCLTCVVAFIASAVDGYAMLMIYATCLGFFVTGFLFTNIFILIQEVDSSSRFSVNIGFVMMLSAIGDVCAGYLSGWPTGFALKRWSCRQVGVAGALIFFAGTLLSVFATSIEYLFATFAVLTGIGSGMTLVSLVTMVESHFKDNFALTYSFISTGVPVGKFVLPPLIQVFINIYGWRGGLLLESALIFHIEPFACLFRSNHPQSSSTTERKTNMANHEAETRSDAYNNLQLQILEDTASSCHMGGECDDDVQEFEENATSPQYTESPEQLPSKSVSMIRSCPNFIPTLPVWIITFVYVLQSFSFTAVSVHIVAKMTDTGASGTKASIALSLIGLGAVIGRIINGIVVHRRWLSPIKIEITITCLTCVVAFIASAVDGYVMLMVYATCLGFFVPGFLFTNIYILIQEVDLSSRFSVNIGFVTMLSAIGDVCAGYLPGLIRDITGSYEIAFYIAGGAFLLALLLTISLYFLEIRRRSPVVHSSSALESEADV
ncbi:uncharacterized protein [Amphiura filiformis]|uniref:uncharacterized protein n=1 Tax=Amphiura filiformis TaxID=82378 RepID=UPI003B2130B9